uniref:Uncharacterized protein n=1 Tax=Acrobeloides nanus TaxID=290746 RepID=A0A914EE57_9BILA
MKKWLNQEGFTLNERKYMADFAEIFKFGNLLLFYYIEAHTDRTVASAFCTALFQRWLEIQINDEIMPIDNRVVIHMPEPTAPPQSPERKIGWELDGADTEAPESLPPSYSSGEPNLPRIYSYPRISLRHPRFHRRISYDSSRRRATYYDRYERRFKEVQTEKVDSATQAAATVDTTTQAEIATTSDARGYDQEFFLPLHIVIKWVSQKIAKYINQVYKITKDVENYEDGQDQLVEQDDKQGDGQGVQRDRPGSQICQQCQELCAHGIETSCKDCLKQWTIMVLGKEGKQQDVGQGAQEDQPFVQICQRCTGICANELGQDCPDCINDLYQWMAINGKGGLIFESYWQGSCLFDCIEDYQYQDCQNCLRRIREIGDHLIYYLGYLAKASKDNNQSLITSNRF